MTVNDLFNALMNAGVLSKIEGNRVILKEGDFSCVVSKINGGSWLVSLPNETGDVVPDSEIIGYLQDLLVDKSMSQDRGIEFVVRRLVWYLKDVNSFVMRPYKDIMDDQNAAVSIGVYNSVMLSFSNGCLHGTDLVSGGSYAEFKSVKELMNACH